MLAALSFWLVAASHPVPSLFSLVFKTVGCPNLTHKFVTFSGSENGQPNCFFCPKSQVQPKSSGWGFAGNGCSFVVESLLDCYWVGSLDINFLVETKLCFPLNPQRVVNFLQGQQQPSLCGMENLPRPRRLRPGAELLTGPRRGGATSAAAEGAGGTGGPQRTEPRRSSEVKSASSILRSERETPYKGCRFLEKPPKMILRSQTREPPPYGGSRFLGNDPVLKGKPILEILGF